MLDRDIAQGALEDEPIRRLLTITGVNLTVAAGLMAAIGSIDRFASPQKLVSYFGLNPRVRQSGLGPAHHGRFSKAGRSHARAMLVEAAWAAAKAPGPLRAFFIRIRARRGHQIAAVLIVAQFSDLTTLAVSCSTSLHGDHTPGLLGEKVEKLVSIYLLAKSNSPIGAGAVELKHVLCQVDANYANFCHGCSLLRSDILNEITLAHCDAVRRGHPRHH